MKRRALVARFGGTAIAWSIGSVLANDENRRHKIGVVSDLSMTKLASFKEGLRALGWKPPPALIGPVSCG